MSNLVRFYENISSEVIKRVCTYNPNLTETIKKLQKVDTDTFLHNKYRLRHFNKSFYTFEGKYNCGATCYVLYSKLRSRNIKTQVIKNRVTIKNKLHDHVVLKYGDKIIDPTYRQLLTPNYDDIIAPNVINALNTQHNNIGIDRYHNYIFSKPFVLFQNKYDKDEFIEKCNEIYFETYNQSMIKRSIDAKLLISLDGQDITERFNDLLTS